MRQNILVTGGAGYIGSHVCKRLSQSGFLPISFDNLTEGHRSSVKWGPLIVGDLRNSNDVASAFANGEIAGVIHAAGRAYVGESMENPDLYYANNVIGSLNLFGEMLRNMVSKIVFSSSCTVYGSPATVPVTEEMPIAAASPYGETKAAVERALHWYGLTSSLSYIALRYFNAAGADPEGEIGETHRPETHAVPLAIEAALGQRPHFDIFGDDYPTPDGTCIRDYVHVCDLADAHVLAIRHLLNSGGSDVFNLSSGKGTSVTELLNTIDNLTGTKINRRMKPRRTGDAATIYATGERAKTILGWQPKQSDIQGIVKSAVAWHTSRAQIGQ